MSIDEKIGHLLFDILLNGEYNKCYTTKLGDRLATISYIRDNKLFESTPQGWVMWTIATPTEGGHWLQTERTDFVIKSFKDKSISKITRHDDIELRDYWLIYNELTKLVKDIGGLNE